jgi:hypothetical protein
METKLLKKIKQESKENKITKTKLVEYALKHTFKNKDLTLKLD